jgi:hypothetical protein
MLLRAGTLEVAVIAFARPFGARGVDLAAIEAPPLLGIAEQVVGHRDLLELLFRLLVARIEIGMQLLRQFAIGRANLVLRGLFLDAQDRVRILAHRDLLCRLMSPPAAPTRRSR